MTEISAGRALAQLLVAWLGMSAVASLQAVLPMRTLPGLRPGPDVAALVVLYVGLAGRGGPAGMGALAVAIGYLADLSGGSPKGVHMAACLVFVLVARLASARLMVRGALFTAMVAAFFCSFYELALGALRIGLDPQVGLGPMRRVPLAVLSTALFAPIVFAILRRIDRSFSRDPKKLGRSLSPAR